MTLAETTRRGNATRLARGAPPTGTELVVVLGGDGTLNEAANGLAGTDCALATLPGGSTNVFARTLGLPNDPVEAAAVLLDALERGAPSARSGSARSTAATSSSTPASGFDAATVRQVEKRSALKRYAGHPLFIWAAVTTWLRHYDRAQPHFAVHLPDGSVVDDGYFTLVMNTDPYTFLGNRPLHVTDAAGLDQPLAALTLRSIGLGTLLGVAGDALSAAARSATVARSTSGRGSTASGSPASARSRTRSTATTSARPRARPSGTSPTPSACSSPDARRQRPRARRATSGTLVTMASTPRAASSAMRSGSSTVHVLTATPASWARATSAASTAGSQGWSAPWPWSTQVRTAAGAAPGPGRSSTR